MLHPLGRLLPRDAHQVLVQLPKSELLMPGPLQADATVDAHDDRMAMSASQPPPTAAVKPLASSNLPSEELSPLVDGAPQPAGKAYPATVPKVSSGAWGSRNTKVHPEGLEFSEEDLAGLATIQGDELEYPAGELTDSMAEWEHSIIGRLRGLTI